MRTALIVWAVCSAIGGAIVALPDSGPRLVSFSQAHGPSAVDAIGIGVLLAGWVVFARAAWRRRDRVVRRGGHGLLLAVGFALGVGVGLVIASAAADYAYWWVIGGIVLLAAQLLVAYLADA